MHQESASRRVGLGRRETVRVAAHRKLAGPLAGLLLLATLPVAPASVAPGTSRVAGETLKQPRSEPRAGALDGLAFQGPTGARGMQAHHEDRLVFEDGGFRSLACERLGFEKSVYHATADGGAVRFEAVSVSPGRGTLSWRGVVRDGRLEARYTWVKERWLWTTRQEYWFSGVVSEASDALASGC